MLNVQKISFQQSLETLWPSTFKTSLARSLALKQSDLDDLDFAEHNLIEYDMVPVTSLT